ncbi:MAG: ROK family protein [Alphaproteobacteria bacterium]|nr:ROK family protein [Alphaproteobacteria bacterium]MBV8547982.1 ROK family protein [Alphaproteobacteria bacterium]
MYATGLDIGGTKIAGAVYDNVGTELTRIIEPIPKDYALFLQLCVNMVERLDQACGAKASVGIGMPGVISRDGNTFYAVANIPFLRDGHPFADDLTQHLQRSVRVANDGQCATLAEAFEGAGQGANTVFGITLGTGVGGGAVVNGHIISGRHGMAGEIGHVALPHASAEDGEPLPCKYCPTGCIEGYLSGAALAKRYERLTGDNLPVADIAARAGSGEQAALQVVDAYCRGVAKAISAVLHTYDPDIVIISGGLSVLPNLLRLVNGYVRDYALFKDIETQVVAAKLGALSGLRGAAILGQQG